MTGVGILGATGKTSFAYIAQRSMQLLQGHPFLDVRALIADDPADVGKPFAEAVKDRWMLDEAIPNDWAGIRMIGTDAASLRDAGVTLVLSALSGPLAKELDPKLAAHGFGVISESIGLRQEPDVPLVVPEVNADHLRLIAAQRRARGWETGFVVSSPLCTAVIAAIAFKPLVDAYGLRSSIFTTLQAMSGAGRTGVAGLAIMDNILPFIGQEEEKLYAELPKILGTYTDNGIRPLATVFAATCTRVPVRDGHTIAATVSLDRPADPADAAGVFARYTSRSQELGLTFAPKAPIIVRSEDNRPQPFLDRDADQGRAVSVGRIRPAAIDNGLSFVAVGHNHERGTYGNALILTELVVKEGLVVE